MTFNLSKTLTRRSSTQSQQPVGHHSEHSHAEHHSARPLPFMASPVDPEALKWVRNKKLSAAGAVVRAKTVAQFEAEAQTESALANRIFRKQHEASTLELFFDLFFVANLAIFTARSSHVDWQSLSNYLGFFAILWSTWFHISMYDVRFYVDSIFTRICKFITFGIMVSFVGLSSLYGAILEEKNSRAFQGIALILFGSRALLMVQYGTVMFFVREFDKTMIPLLLTMFVYILTGMGYLATWLPDRTAPSISGTEGQKYTRIWYGIIGAEAVAVIIIASIWRVLSFKHTHLVERVGLLTLIVLGEGIIGIVKSTSYAIQGTEVSLRQETVIISAAVLIIYLLYVLYFDNIDHHRFGTIAQQIWTLLHFPLHVSILLTVEASTALILWNACREAVIATVESSFPLVTNPIKNATRTFTSNADFVAGIQSSYDQVKLRYYYKDLYDYYNITTDLAKLDKTKAEFGSTAWKDEVSPTIKKMGDYIQYFIYQNFGAEGPYDKLKKEKEYGKKVLLYEEGFRFVTCYFYVSAGVVCFVLAFLYWFGRKQKTRTEWTSIGVRIFGGMCLPLGIIAPVMETPGKRVGFRYQHSTMIIPIVAFGFLLVIIVDNVVKAISERHHHNVEDRRLSRQSSMPLANDMEMSSDSTSYDVHRSRSVRKSSNLHGIPEMVDHEDGVSLVDNGAKPGMKGPTAGYAELEQEEQDEDMGYRGQTSPQQARFGSLRKY